MLEVMVGSLLPDQTKRVIFRLHCPSGEPGTSILLGVSAGGTLPDSANSVEANPVEVELRLARGTENNAQPRHIGRSVAVVRAWQADAVRNAMRMNREGDRRAAKHFLERELRWMEPYARGEFEFHGFTGKRRVVSFDWRYDFNEAKLQQAQPIPDFLLPLRQKATHFADVDPRTIEHVLVTEYGPGAAIGWHRDRPIFADVIGISLLSPCTFRFRKQTDAGWQRRSVRLAPRSAYLLRGPARTDWEHSLPGVESLRYSITFRNFKAA